MGKGIRQSPPPRKARPGMRWVLAKVSEERANTNKYDPFGDAPANARGRCVLHKDGYIVRWRWVEVYDGLV